MLKRLDALELQVADIVQGRPKAEGGAAAAAEDAVQETLPQDADREAVLNRAKEGRASPERLDISKEDSSEGEEQARQTRAAERK